MPLDISLRAEDAADLICEAADFSPDTSFPDTSDVTLPKFEASFTAPFAAAAIPVTRAPPAVLAALPMFDITVLNVDDKRPAFVSVSSVWLRISESLSEADDSVDSICWYCEVSTPIVKADPFCSIAA